MLKNWLLDRGYTQSKVDLHLFYEKDSAIAICINNNIIFNKNYKKFQENIKSREKNFKLTNEGDLTLEIDITKNKNET